MFKAYQDWSWFFSCQPSIMRKTNANLIECSYCWGHERTRTRTSTRGQVGVLLTSRGGDPGIQHDPDISISILIHICHNIS